MPGIFLTRIDKYEKEGILPEESDKALSKKEIKKSRWHLFRKKYVLFIFLIFALFIFKSWNRVPTQIVVLPHTHVDFIGRDKELLSLKQQLLKKRNSRGFNLTAICGEGGIGKTELAIAFGNHHIGDFSFIGWIDGTNEETIMHSYTDLGERLGIKEEHPSKLRERIHRKLENFSRKPWLLIFDDIKDILPDFPKSGGSLLLTCRDKSICPPQAVLELNKDPREAMLILSKLTGEKKSECMDELAKKLDYLPLMVNMAGHYIAETPGISLSSYSDIVSSTMETQNSPLKKTEFRKRYPRSLVATYLITIQMLGRKHPLSLEFLKQAIFLYPKNIPVQFLTYWLEDKSQYNPSEIILLKGDILRELKNHSLIRHDSKGDEFSIHPLLHQALMLEFKGEEGVSKGLKILSKFASIHHYNPTLKDTIRPFQQILPHCIAILDQIKTPDPSAIKLAMTIARYFIDTAHQLKNGEKYLLLARQWTQGSRHPIEGRVAFLQGVLKFRQADQQKDKVEREKRYLEALTFFTEALAIYQQHNNDSLYQAIEQNPLKCTKEYQRAICQQYRAQMMRVLGRLEEAERGFLLALGAFQDISQNKDHFDIARIFREQALILWEKGERQAAIKRVREAVAMQKRVYGNIYHFQPTLAATYRTLGDFLLEMKCYSKSDKAYRKAIKINQAAYQTEIHPYLGSLYHQRAVVLAAQGKKSLAEKMERKSQEIRALAQ